MSTNRAARDARSPQAEDSQALRAQRRESLVHVIVAPVVSHQLRATLAGIDAEIGQNTLPAAHDPRAARAARSTSGSRRRAPLGRCAAWEGEAVGSGALRSSHAPPFC